MYGLEYRPNIYDINLLTVFQMYRVEYTIYFKLNVLKSFHFLQVNISLCWYMLVYNSDEAKMTIEIDLRTVQYLWLENCSYCQQDIYDSFFMECNRFHICFDCAVWIQTVTHPRRLLDITQMIIHHRSIPIKELLDADSPYI